MKPFNGGNMKTIYVSWTYFENIEIEDDMTPDEIEELLDGMEPEGNTWHSRDWGYNNES